MERATLDQLEAALEAVRPELTERVEQLAAKSSEGTLSQEEHAEYEQIVVLNDLLSSARLQARQLRLSRIR